MNKYGLLIILITGLFLSGCTGSSDSVAGVDGGATETTNGYVLSTKGEPVKSACVKLIAQDEWLERMITTGNAVIESTYTGIDGSFSMRSPEMQSFNIQIITDTEGLVLRDYDSLSSEVSRDTLRLKSLSEFSGAVSGSGNLPGSIMLSGTDIRADVNSDTSFCFTGVPPGYFSVITEFGSIGSAAYSLPASVSIEENNDLSVSEISGRDDIILLDDFEKEFANSLSSLLTDGGWFSYYDSAVQSDGNSSLDLDYVTGSQAYEKQSMQLKVILRDGASVPNGGIGNFIGDRTVYYNLSELDFIEFMAKGEGVISISVETLGLDTLSGEENHFRWELDIPSDWERVRVDTDSLYVSESSAAVQAGITWVDVSESVNRIEFTFTSEHNPIGDTLECLIDDLRLYGCELNNLN